MIALFIIGAYLLGAVPTSYLAGRVAGVDLRETGSHNLGATNLYRALGWRWAVPAGLLDVAKGFVPVFLVMRVDPSPWLPLAAGGAAILGHVFPVYLRFRGGKGVATAAGAVMGIAPIPTAVSLLVWTAFLVGTGFMSVASLAGAVTFPLVVWAMPPFEPWLFGGGVTVASFITFTHRDNIRRLWAGTEARVGRPTREA